jgi:type I restriction enzyme M protein
VKRIFEAWKSENIAILEGITVGSNPKELIEKLSENLLHTFATIELIDPYVVYQHMMSYWTETLQDDVYMIVADGWKASRELVPPELLVKHYFSSDQEAIQALEVEKEGIQQQMLELDDEHGGEGSYLEDTKNDKGKITKAGILARLRDVNLDPEADDEEQQILVKFLSLIEKDRGIGIRIRDGQRTLDAKVTARYSALSENEVKALAVEAKWLLHIVLTLQGDHDHITQNLTARVKELAERYGKPLSQIINETEILTGKVEENMSKMGFVWN